MSKRQPLQYDHGYAWIVLFACFCIQFITFAYALAFGVYFSELLQEYKASRADVALAGSLAYGFSLGLGPITTVVFKRFGARLTMGAGGIIAAGGLALSCFSTSIQYMQISYGLITGVGLGLVYVPTLAIQPQYFQKYLIFATAFVSVGSALGTFVMPFVFRELIRVFTWRGSMLINAGICLQIIVLAGLVRTRKFERHASLKSYLDLPLLKRSEMWFMWANCFCWGGSVFIVFSMIPNYARAQGISEDSAVWLAVISGGGSVVGRATSSFIGHWPRTDNAVFYTATSFLFAVSNLLIAFSRTFLTLSLSTAAAGLFFGHFLAQIAPVNLGIFGSDALAHTAAYQMTGVAVGGVLLPVVAGILADGFGTEMAFVFASCLSGLATVMCILTFTTHRRREAAAATQNTLLDSHEPMMMKNNE